MTVLDFSSFRLNLSLTLMKFDYGPMRKFELLAEKEGDLSILESAEQETANPID